MKKLTTDEFIARSKMIHNNKYDYSLSIYTASKEQLIRIPYWDFENISNILDSLLNFSRI